MNITDELMNIFEIYKKNINVKDGYIYGYFSTQNDFEICGWSALLFYSKSLEPNTIFINDKREIITLERIIKQVNNG